MTLSERIARLRDIEERNLAHALAETADLIERACRDARSGDWKSAMLVHGLYVRFAVLNARALERERSRSFRSLRRDIAERVVRVLTGKEG